MKSTLALCLAFCLSAVPCWADIQAGRYDMASVRDASTLETKVIEDWHPLGKDTSLRQKLVEITVCDWWPGQKIRLPVTFVAPATGVCKNVIIANAGLPVKAAAPTGSMLRLLKGNGVGLVFIGMGTMDAMEPVGQLHTMMKEHFLQSKDARYTPAWIWGMSDMRALTAAIAEKDVFQPAKVIATGGSKRGVATAAAGIADDRFTAIMPVVAPIIDSPGGPYVEGMMPAEITKMNEQFVIDATAGKLPRVPSTASAPLMDRQKIRADERITLQQARDAGWSQEEIVKACTAAWEVCRTTNYLPSLQKRGVEILYNQGSNDNVGPGLIELGKRFPSLPIYVIPGGQHGGAKETGLNKPVGSQPDVEENLYAFAQHHFFGTRKLLPAPVIATAWDASAHRLHVTATFADQSEPQTNTLHWSINRHPDYSMEMEYDEWLNAPLTGTGAGKYEGDITLAEMPRTLDVLTVHVHEENGSKLTISSPYLRADLK